MTDHITTITLVGNWSRDPREVVDVIDRALHAAALCGCHPGQGYTIGEETEPVYTIDQLRGLLGLPPSQIDDEPLTEEDEAALQAAVKRNMHATRCRVAEADAEDIAAVEAALADPRNQGEPVPADVVRAALEERDVRG